MALGNANAQDVELLARTVQRPRTPVIDESLTIPATVRQAPKLQVSEDGTGLPFVFERMMTATVVFWGNLLEDGVHFQMKKAHFNAWGFAPGGTTLSLELGRRYNGKDAADPRLPANLAIQIMDFYGMKQDSTEGVPEVVTTDYGDQYITIKYKEGKSNS